MEATSAGGLGACRTDAKREERVTTDEPKETGADAQSARARVLDTDTWPASDLSRGAPAVRVPALTLLWHADLERVGERAWLPELEEGRGATVSRLEPSFGPPAGRGEPRPLADPGVSRQPLHLEPSPDGVVISSPPDLPPVEIDGERLHADRVLSHPELDRGVVLLIAGRIALLLQRRTPEASRPPAFGLIGESARMLELRRQIEGVADLESPVLLRGASGTGKELVARAIQSHGRRRDRPFLAINVAAVPPTLAASELFGAARGAFSGADRPRAGYFQEADGGTLFLDEIGETPRDVQALLLRALENGEIQPVGAARPRRVDVRVIAATDADLEAAARDGRFSAPLLERLRSLEIQLPALRESVEDIGRLFLHFLREELGQVGEEHRLEPRGPWVRPFVSARLVARLARHPWPGNVRELRNEVRRLVVASRGRERLSTGAWLSAPTGKAAVEGRPEKPPATPEPPPRSSRRRRRHYRDPSSVGEEEMVETLLACDWNVKAAAEALGISRASLYTLIDGSPSLRKAGELESEEIVAALESHAHDLQAAARALRVSTHGLKRRITDLDLPRERKG